MKTGPKSGDEAGFYQSLLRDKFHGKYPPPLLGKRNSLEAQRRKMVRALHRRLHQKAKYRKFSKWVCSIRAALHKSRKEFASLVGVSGITLKRWELGLGHLPSRRRSKNKHSKEVPSNWERLEKLAALSKDLEKSGTPFEEN